jgi:hypothetical protein
MPISALHVHCLLLMNLQIYVAVTKPKVEYLNPENQVCGRQRAASNSDRPRASSCPASRPYVPITEETKADLRQEFGEFADMIMVLHQHNMPVKMYGSDCHAADILKAAYRFNAQRHVRHVITERVDMMLSVEAIRSLEDVGSMVVRAIHLYLQLW